MIKRVTHTLQAESVESEIDYEEPASLEGKQQLELPHISDGGGVATEIVLINPTADDIETTLSFVSSDGKRE